MHTYILLSLLISVTLSCSALKKIQCSTAALKCGTLCLIPNIPCIVCVTATSANCCDCMFPDWYGCNTTEITNLAKQFIPKIKNITLNNVTDAYESAKNITSNNMNFAYNSFKKFVY